MPVQARSVSADPEVPRAPGRDGARADAALAPDNGAWLALEARLADELRAAGRSPTRPSEILLTGATGFLGRQIAAALLRTTESRLHCLVRDQPGRPARARCERLRRHLGAEPWRLTLVEGDLPGTSPADPSLAREIDTIVHCAGDGNLFAPYPTLRGPNVLATRAVLALAARGAPKAVHFVSTTGVFLSPRYRSRTVYEDVAVEGAEGLRNGYAQSRWVADTMMARARLRGVPVTIYRPAFVGWHTQTGHAGEKDIVALLLRSSRDVGCAPDLDLQINSTPVDHVADVVAAIVSTPSAQGATYHLANRAAVRFVDLAAMAELPLVTVEEWEAAVIDRAPRFASLATLVRRAQRDPGSGADELRFTHDRRYDDARLRAALGPAYRAPPPFDAAYLTRFLRSPDEEKAG
jgi:thioester reductase-like protein